MTLNDTSFNPEDALKVLDLLTKFKNQTEEFGNSKELEKIDSTLFFILITGMHSLEGQMQTLNHTINNHTQNKNQKRSKSYKLKRNWSKAQKLLTEELDWSTPPVQLNSRIESSSIKTHLLKVDPTNNKLNNARENYIWKKEMILAEIQDNIRKIRFFVDRFNIHFVDSQNHFNRIEHNAFKLEAVIEEILRSYNDEIQAVLSNKIRLSIGKLWTKLKDVKMTLDTFTNRLSELETNTIYLYLLSSPTSVPETVEIVVPGNPPFQTLEYQKVGDCLDQLQKMIELTDKLQSCLLDLISRRSFTTKLIFEIDSQINSLPD